MVSDNSARMYRADDKLKNVTFVRAVDVNTSAGGSEMDFDARSGKFYLTDAGDRIYRFGETGEIEQIDVLGDGFSMNGLAIDANAVLPDAPIETEPTETESETETGRETETGKETETGRREPKREKKPKPEEKPKREKKPKPEEKAKPEEKPEREMRQQTEAERRLRPEKRRRKKSHRKEYQMLQESHV